MNPVQPEWSGSQLDTFRQVRRELEAAILPLATSVDGRRFSPQPALLPRFGARISQEGGADVPATWAAAASLRAGEAVTR